MRNQLAEKAKAPEASAANGNAGAAAEKRRRRWDQTAPVDDDPKAKKAAYGEVRDLFRLSIRFFLFLSRR